MIISVLTQEYLMCVKTLTLRHYAAAARLRGGRQGLPLHVLQRAHGARDPGPQVHRGWTVQQPPVWNQHTVCQRSR